MRNVLKMFGSGRAPASYYELLSSTEERARSSNQIYWSKSSKNRPALSALLVVSCTSLFLLVVGMIIGWRITTMKNSVASDSSFSTTSCESPALRREWRSLSREEKGNYIESVKCLKERPSFLDLNQSLYDDFPWIHKHVGEYCTVIPRPSCSVFSSHL